MGAKIDNADCCLFIIINHDIVLKQALEIKIKFHFTLPFVRGGKSSYVSTKDRRE
jgi:hypothetical protein